MPEQSATLTSRRKSPDATKRGSSSTNDSSDKIVKVLVWVVVVVLVAVVIYLLINNLRSTQTVEDEPVAEVADEPVQSTSIIAAKLSSSLAESAPESTDYDMTDQTVGSESEDNFTIESFKTESYDKFFRFIFEVSSDGTSDYPMVDGEYKSSSIAIDFMGIVSDSAGLTAGNLQQVEGSVVDSFERTLSSGENVYSFTIRIDEESGYFMHLLEDPNRVVIDVMEPEEIETTEDGTSTDDAETEDATAPTTNTLTNEFSKTQQFIVTDQTANTIYVTKFAYQDSGTALSYVLDLAGGIPNANAKLVDTNGVFTLVVTMENRVATDKTETIDFASVPIATSLDIVTSGNTTIYTFNLTKETDFRILATESPAQFTVELKN